LHSVPDSINDLLIDGQVDIGKWLEIKLSDLNVDNLPQNVVDHMAQYGGKLGYTQVT
jgi:hypothetical protein